jgi:hypothetical protein
MMCTTVSYLKRCTRGDRPASMFKLTVQTLGMHIMTSWHPAFSGITQCVTSNPFCHLNLVSICDVVVMSSCHAPLTHTACFIFLQSFTFTMKHSQVWKWCISMAMHRTQQILCFSLIINFVLQVSSLIWPAGQGIPVPAGFFPALFDQLAIRNAPEAVGFRYAH